MARNAGRTLANTVTMIPMASATTTVRVSSTSPLLGSVKPTASKSLNRPFASPMPATTPTIEASTPVTSASTITDVSTWRRDAPIVRSVANSRMRCAIVIESELEITNAPTNSAMPPNASRKLWRKEMNEVASEESFFAWAAAVRTCVASGRIGLICFASCSGVTPWIALALIWSSLPTLRNSVWAVGRSNPASVAPPRLEAPPKCTSPEIRNGSTGPSAWMPIDWPTLKSFFEAVDWSITTWPACGHAPSTSVSEFIAGCVGSTLKPRFGAPPMTIALPFLPIRWASPATPPTAS